MIVPLQPDDCVEQDIQNGSLEADCSQLCSYHSARIKMASSSRIKSLVRESGTA